MAAPSRGEIWVADLDPIRGREQGGRRPVLIVSVDPFNNGRSGLVVVVPLTSHDKAQPLHVPLVPPDGGVVLPSWVKCEDVRSVSVDRLTRCWGRVDPETLQQVDRRLRRLLGL